MPRTQNARLAELVRRALSDLPLTAAQRRRALPPLLKRTRFLRDSGATIAPDSEYLQFARKAEGVVARLAHWGLTLPDYLAACVRQPVLFGQAPGTITANITDTVARLAPAGLTGPDYLRTALRQPQLFYQSPDTVCGNVTEVARRLAGCGLTLRAYVVCALRQPPLFCLRPATVVGNVTGVAEWLGARGITAGAYVEAALRQPQLFAHPASTTTRKLEGLFALRAEGVIAPPAYTRDARGRPDDPDVALLLAILRAPQFLCLSEDNYRLRRLHQKETGCPPSFANLTRPRAKVEAELRRALGDRVPKGKAGRECLVRMARGLD